MALDGILLIDCENYMNQGLSSCQYACSNHTIPMLLTKSYMQKEKQKKKNVGKGIANI